MVLQMKKFFVFLISLCLVFQVFAKGGHVRVNGYYKSNGTYVQPHFRSAPDGIKSNNWSHYGNVNPYTGKVGTNRDGDVGYYGGGGYVYPNGFSGHNAKRSIDYVVD